ncbi:MAG: (d)CMP kinase [Clostridia bacterium]
MKDIYVLAIDGGSATGKTTLAKSIGKNLNILYIDTGAMYRVTALYFLEKNIELTDKNIKANIDNIKINIKYIDGIMRIFLNNQDVTEQIRKNEVSMAASNVSTYKLVRDKLVSMQRKMAENESVVLEGRDIGSVVFPNADLKIFLTASIDQRAKRRKHDLEKKGEFISLTQIKEELEKRDLQDSTRKESPLKISDDSILIDTTNLSKEATVNKVIKLLKERI